MIHSLLSIGREGNLLPCLCHSHCFGRAFLVGFIFSVRLAGDASLKFLEHCGLGKSSGLTERPFFELLKRFMA